jgi:enterochelin esterase-like enzyme
MSKRHTSSNYAGSIDERYISSKEANSTFLIQIYLPLTYSETQKKYLILAITDAFWSMGMAKTAFDLLTFGKEIPEVIIVSIGYPYSRVLNMG